jgi:hypothetical protein
MLNIAHAMNMRLSELIRMFEEEQSASREAAENQSVPQ